MSFEKRIKDLKLEIPKAPDPVGAYVAYQKKDNLVFISGQISLGRDGKLIKGKVGKELSLEEGQKAAYACGINIISQIKSACNGNLNKVKRVVKLGGFVASTPDFTDQPKIINGASDLFVKIFGEKGKHSRFAVGTSSLPLNVPVEIEGVFEIEN